MCTLKPLMRTLLCAGAALLAGGCMSARTTTNLQPGSDPALTSSAGTFHIANLKYANSDRRFAQNDREFERSLLPFLRKECVARYPALFVDESAGGIPLGVEVSNTTTMHDGKMMAWMFCTLTLCGVIFPCPAQTDEDIDVQVRVWSGRDTLLGARLQKSFRQETHMWISLLTPLALITVPGESDFPKMSGTVFGYKEQMNCYYKQVAQQIATATAHLVAATDAAHWTAQPRAPAASGAPAAPAALPTILPPPTEGAVPF